MVEAIFIIKKKFPGSLLWAPGIGGPDNCAVMTWFGIDLFDTTRSKQAEAHGAVLTWSGPRMVTEDEPDVDHWQLALTETRSAISNHSLRELAQSQSLSSPRLVEHMRHFDNLISSKEGVLSQIVDSSTALRIHSVESHDDPIILDWVNFMTNDYTSPEGLDDILVLLPCSARKPYSFSRSHRSFHRAMNHNAAHEVMVTSPLGLVPRDLEQTWPAGYYDIPVTGDWTQDEIIRVTQMIDSLVERNNYRLIINHSGMEYNSETPLIDTRQGSSATNPESLERLGKAIYENVRVKRRSGEKMNLDNFKSVARLHHLNDLWLEGTEVRGRIPRWKILKDGEQLAMWAPERGGFSLAKPSIPILESLNSLKRVNLKENIKWKGDINLAILESYDESIRAGEDILVMQGSQCLGSARAAAPAWEWGGTPGRLAKSHQRL